MAHIFLEGPASPLLQSLALTACGFILILLGKPKIAAIPVLAGTAWLLLCSSSAFSDLLLKNLKSQHHFSPTTNLKADAIVVLGGGAMPPLERPWVDNKLQRTRIGLALVLYKNNQAPILLLSGANREAEMMATGLKDQGISQSAIRLETKSSSTRENAINSSAILKQVGAQRILLVTSTVHMPRAMACFQKLGFDVIPAPVEEDSLRLSAQSFGKSTLNRSERYIHEYMGLTAYKIMGWI